MTKRFYTQGNDGQYEITVPELVNKTIQGGLYRNGKFYGPSDMPRGSKFKFDSLTGRFTFAIAFDGPETLNIPYDN